MKLLLLAVLLPYVGEIGREGEDTRLCLYQHLNRIIHISVPTTEECPKTIVLKEETEDA